jgi:hypothetical protein
LSLIVELLWQLPNMFNEEVTPDMPQQGAWDKDEG